MPAGANVWVSALSTAENALKSTTTPEASDEELLGASARPRLAAFQPTTNEPRAGAQQGASSGRSFSPPRQVAGSPPTSCGWAASGQRADKLDTYSAAARAATSSLRTPIESAASPSAIPRE